MLLLGKGVIVTLHDYSSCRQPDVQPTALLWNRVSWKQQSFFNSVVFVFLCVLLSLLRVLGAREGIVQLISKLYYYNNLVLLLFCFIFGGTGVWTQGLKFVRIYHLSQSISSYDLLVLVFVFCSTGGWAQNSTYLRRRLSTAWVMLPDLFALVTLVIGSYFLPGLAWTDLLYASHCCWNNRCTSPHPAFFCWDGVS
jgi:hypothetical protein